MIDLPPELLKQQFYDCLVRGAIFLCTNYDFWDSPPKPKYLLVLNVNEAEGVVYYYLPTSNVGPLSDNPILSKDSCIIPAGQVECFKKETGINTRNIESEKTERLLQKFMRQPNNDCLKFCQMIPRDIMTLVDKIIAASNQLSLQEKLNVLPPNLKAR